MNRPACVLAEGSRPLQLGLQAAGPQQWSPAVGGSQPVVCFGWEDHEPSPAQQGATGSISLSTVRTLCPNRHPISSFIPACCMLGSGSGAIPSIAELCTPCSGAVGTVYLVAVIEDDHLVAS